METWYLVAIDNAFYPRGGAMEI